MNIATDLIEREHEEIEGCIAAFERKPHRSCALDLCAITERHGAMEDDVLHPLQAGIDPQHARSGRDDHEHQRGLVDRIRHASDRDELRALVGELGAQLRRHVEAEEGQVLPSMEDAVGVGRMNELGMDLLDWQHRDARERRESDDQLEDLLSLTRAELYERAQDADLDGRSTMKKADLAEALAES
jgi:hypothetical protein